MTTPAEPSGGNVFTRKVGPVPLWVWMVVALVIAGAYYLYKKHQSTQTQAAASTNTPGGTDSSLVPQFVNQVYNQETPPAAPNVTVNNNDNDQPIIIRGPINKPPAPKPPNQQLTRTWTSEGGSTYAAVAGRLLGNGDVANLHPANQAAQNWVNNVYKKNKNAKMPKGLVFTYTEGTVTNKPAAKAKS